MKVVQFGTGGPPGGPLQGAEGWRAVTRVLRSCAATLRHDAVTTAFPADCVLCSCPMTAWSPAPVCVACVQRVGPQHGALCAICGEILEPESARFAAALGSTSCTLCRLAPPAFTRAVAYAAYEDELRELLHLLKYSHIARLADGQLGDWLAQTIAQLQPQAAPELTVIAVPLFAARQRERRFNQSALLADAAIAKLRRSHPEWKLIPAHAALIRHRDTGAQFGLNPHQRRRNLRGAFRVADATAITGREVLLIDDIMTTGATARECARVLVRSGATRVWVATVARAQPERFTAAEPHSRDIAMWDAAIDPKLERRQSF